MWEIEDEQGDNLAHYAASQGNLGALQYLYLVAPDLLHASNQSGCPPCANAAQHGHLEELRFLLECTAGSRPVDVHGGGLAHWAAEGGHVNILELVVAMAPECLNSVDLLQRTPAHWAAFKGNQHALCFLHREAPGALLAIDSMGRTPAHYAAEEGGVEAVAFILSAEPGLVEAPDQGGATAAHWAAAGGHSDVLELLQASMLPATDNEGCDN